MTHNRKHSMIWTLAITSVALFMVTLDNLVVTTALPVIRRDLHATISQLEWTVNAYTLTFAVLLLTGAALGDRFGRRRLFALGILLFTGASAVAALATTANQLDIARAVQGVGGAIVAPLTLTILSAGVPAAKRGLALGIWGGIGGLAIAIGPLVGGAVVSGISWHWIFWLNVPIGLVLAPLALARLEETRGSDSALDLPGLALVSSGLLGIVWALVRGNQHGWTSLGIVAPLVAGAALVGAFVWWESRTTSPMLPLEFFRDRTFTLANIASLFMFFGMFGSIFFLAQFFQTVQGYSPLQSGLRILPWTAMPIFVAPIAGALSDRIGGQRLMAAGLALQASGLIWIAAVSTPTLPYTRTSSRRSSSRASGWRSSSRPSPTSCSAPSGPTRRGRPRARTTRSASSAASSASRCWLLSSRGSAATKALRRSSTARRLRSTSAERWSPSERWQPRSSPRDGPTPAGPGSWRSRCSRPP